MRACVYANVCSCEHVRAQVRAFARVFRAVYMIV